MIMEYQNTNLGLLVEKWKQREEKNDNLLDVNATVGGRS